MGDGLKRARTAARASQTKSQLAALPRDKHQICRDFELSLQNQIKDLKAQRRALKQLVRNLHQFVVHDSCASEHSMSDDECDCGLADYQAMYRRLVR